MFPVISPLSNENGAHAKWQRPIFGGGKKIFVWMSTCYTEVPQGRAGLCHAPVADRLQSELNPRPLFGNTFLRTGPPRRAARGASHYQSANRSILWIVPDVGAFARAMKVLFPGRYSLDRTEIAETPISAIFERGFP